VRPTAKTTRRETDFISRRAFFIGRVANLQLRLLSKVLLILFPRKEARFVANQMTKTLENIKGVCYNISLWRRVGRFCLHPRD
jgi:hypothetical protein